MPTHHFADHHDVRTQVLVDAEDVQDSNVPEDDVDAIEDSARALVLRKHAQAEPDEEEDDGDGVRDVPDFGEVHIEFLEQLLRLRSQDLPF